MRLAAVLRAMQAHVWAILPEHLSQMIEALHAATHDGAVDLDAFREQVSARTERPVMRAEGGVAVIPIHGSISYRSDLFTDLFGGTSVGSIKGAVDGAMANPDVGSIVLDIDSPGGTVDGVPELAAHLYGLRGRKPMKAVANTLAASAAYYIGSAADEFVVAPSGMAGSIGVVSAHMDVSKAMEEMGIKVTLISAGKYKTEGSPYEPLGEDARDGIQERVDDAYDQFVGAVARHRRVSVEAVRNGYGEGRVLSARRSLKAGLADRIGTLDSVIAELSGAAPNGKRRMAIGGPTVSTGIAAVMSDLASLPPTTLTTTNTASGLMWIGPVSLAIEPPEIADAPGGRAADSPPTATDSDATHSAPQAEQPKEIQAMSNDTAANGNGAAPAPTREKQLAELVELQPQFASRLPGWIVAETSVAEARAEIKAELQARAPKVPTASGTGSTPPVGHVGVDEKPFRSLGENLIAGAMYGMNKATPEQINRLSAAATGASAGIGADGAFLIQKDYSSDLMKEASEAGVLSSKCASQEVGANSDGLEVVYIDETSRATGSRWGGVQVYRVAEAETVTASKPSIGKWECRLQDMMGLAYMTDRLLADAGAMQAVFSAAFSDEFGFKLDDEIFRGNGVGQCLGVLNAAATISQAAEAGQLADTVVAENLMNMYARVHPRSRSRGFWFYNLELEPQLQKLMIGTGTSAQLVFMPPGGLSGAQYGTIYGRPAIPIEYASAKGDVGDITFLDLSQYQLITKGGLAEAESIHVRFIYNERAFRWVARVNGAPRWKSALTPYKGSATATLSPFVTLAAR
jgi:HK97 family phage major capsid protein